MRYPWTLGPLFVVACSTHPASVVDAGSSQQEALAKQPVAPVAEGLCKPIKRSLPRPSQGEASPCGKDVEGIDPGIKAVDYSNRPEQGFAGRTVHRSGQVDGAHFSGDPQSPMVTEETGCVSAECVRTLWHLAAGLYAEQRLGVVPTSKESVGYFITVEAEGSPGWVQLPLPPSTPSARAEQISKLIGEMDIGYW